MYNLTMANIQGRNM